MLHVTDLSYHILKNISFSLNDNQNLTILGSNGSGKTTLAKALCHLIHNECVSIDTQKVSDLSAHDRAKIVNFIPAKLDIYDEFLTVEDYLKLNVIDPKRASHLDSIMELLHISHLAHNRCHRLSSGESALLLIGGAMLHNARYTILDEPTANLDQKKKVKVYQMLKESLHLNHKIVITHDLNLAYKLGYDILFLEEGTIRYHGGCKPFFEETHLKRFFGNSVRSIEGNYVVNYDEVL